MYNSYNSNDKIYCLYNMSYRFLDGYERIY